MLRNATTQESIMIRVLVAKVTQYFAQTGKGAVGLWE